MRWLLISDHRDQAGERASNRLAVFQRWRVDELVYNERGNKVFLIKYLNDPQD